MVKAVLDEQFAPMALVVRDFQREVEKVGGQDIAICIERNNGYVCAYRTKIFCDGTGKDEENFKFVERLAKSLLWIRGGYKIIIGGSALIAERLKQAYTPNGLLAFDADFMSCVSERPFEV